MQAFKQAHEEDPTLIHDWKTYNEKIKSKIYTSNSRLPKKSRSKKCRYETNE